MSEKVRQGGCNCGAVRILVRDEPIRTGLCHCLTCRKETGSAFMPFAVFNPESVDIEGPTSSWTGTTDIRHFCPACGSSLFSVDTETSEVELRIGALDDAPTGLVPRSELWTERREHWQRPVVGAEQHVRNRNG